MVTERREPTISSGSGSTNAGTTNKGSTAGNNKPRSPQAQGSRPVRSEPKVIVEKQSSGMVWFTFLVALIACGLAGYTFWQLQQSTILVSKQQDRINDLENKLLLTGDESTQSLTALTSNVKSLDKEVKLALSEVDKLWATRNANVKSIETVKTEFNSSIKSLETSLSQNLSSISQQASSQEILIQTLRENSNTQTKKISSLEAQLKQFSAANKKIDKISNTVAGYEETIRSFDKFRLSTNRDLLALKERAGVL